MKHNHHSHPQPRTAAEQQSSIDPVCGMQVGNDSPHSITHEGQRYVFCSAGCRAKFAANPAKYVTAKDDHHHDHGAVPARKPDTEGRPGTIYTCPMHPQVRQLGPGNCPICGMALEPEMPAEQEDDRAIRKVRTKFWIALAFTLPVVGIAMLPHLLDLHVSEAGARVLRGAELLLSAPVVLWAALDYYRRGWLGVVNRSPNMYTLIGLGVIVAFLYSLVATAAPQAFPVEVRDAHGMVGVYFEVASAIVALVLLGEWLELRARGRTSAAIRQLLGLAAKTARLVKPDGTEVVAMNVSCIDGIELDKLAMTPIDGRNR